MGGFYELLNNHTPIWRSWINLKRTHLQNADLKVVFIFTIGKLDLKSEHFVCPTSIFKFNGPHLLNLTENFIFAKAVRNGVKTMNKIDHKPDYVAPLVKKSDHVIYRYTYRDLICSLSWTARLHLKRYRKRSSFECDNHDYISIFDRES